MIKDDARAKLEEYLDAWIERDFKAMWGATQLTAQKMLPYHKFYDMVEPMALVGYEILEVKEHTEESWYVDILVRQKFGQPSSNDVTTWYFSGKSTFRVIREKAAFKPTSEGGTWGVNPISGIGLEVDLMPNSQEAPMKE